MDKGHIYILQTFKNLEDQLLVDNFPIGKEIAMQIPLAAELIDALFELKSKADPDSDAVKRIDDITERVPSQVNSYNEEYDKEFARQQMNVGHKLGDNDRGFYGNQQSILGTYLPFSFKFNG